VNFAQIQDLLVERQALPHQAPMDALLIVVLTLFRALQLLYTEPLDTLKATI
jgi:hypothetical protein